MSSTLRFGKREEQSQSPSRLLVPHRFGSYSVCGGLGFSSQLQSVVNVSADHSVSSCVLMGSERHPQMPVGAWLHLSGARNRESLGCRQQNCVIRQQRMWIWGIAKGEKENPKVKSQQAHNEVLEVNKKENGHGF